MLIGLGLIGVFVSVIFYAFCYVGLCLRLKKVDSAEFYRLGLDLGTQLLGPRGGTKEAQEFISKKRYREHPDPLVVELGEKVYIGTVMAVSSMILIALGMLLRLWPSS